MHYWLVQKYLWTPSNATKKQHVSLCFVQLFMGKSDLNVAADLIGVFACVLHRCWIVLEIIAALCTFLWRRQRQHFVLNQWRKCVQMNTYSLCVTAFFFSMSCPCHRVMMPITYWSYSSFSVPCLRRSVHKQGVRTDALIYCIPFGLSLQHFNRCRYIANIRLLAVYSLALSLAFQPLQNGLLFTFKCFIFV